jgi:hypothetical protein
LSSIQGFKTSRLRDLEFKTRLKSLKAASSLQAQEAFSFTVVDSPAPYISFLSNFSTRRAQVISGRCASLKTDPPQD